MRVHCHAEVHLEEYGDNDEVDDDNDNDCDVSLLLLNITSIVSGKRIPLGN